MIAENDLAVLPPRGRPAPPPLLTFEEFVAWSDENTFAEWVEGEVIFLSTSRVHQLIILFLARILQVWLETRGIAGEVQSAPYPMRPSASRGREPDLLYVAPENKGKLQQNYLEGVSDIAIEIVSPESRKRDREEKYFEYEAAGVREYWLIDPDNEEAEFYRLGENGRFFRVPLQNQTLYHSEVVPGFSFDILWLWQEPKPTVIQTLHYWGLLPVTNSETMQENNADTD